ncbi:MAG: MATE family efflux transporter [Lachnospiraceae bacterium]|nr:MATE family efflux transporter [Lachnospiraceae bacterium]
MRQENKMGVMPVGKLLISMSLPMMISMLIQALYNIVDSIFVAQIGENALTAVSLAFPLQMLTISVSTGTGVGINALLSKSLGEKKFKDANEAATNGIFLAIVSYAVFAVIGLFLVRPFFATQTTDPEIFQYGVSYLSICLIFSFGIFAQVTFERLLQSTGKTVYAMITQMTGAVINLIMDPILIFGLFGAPRMGIAGAAVATVMGQIIAGIFCIVINQAKNKEINCSFKGFRPNRVTIGRIYKVGVPSIIMQSIGSVMTLGFNAILMQFTSTAVSVFGIYFKLQSFIFMPVFGLNNGMIPIIAYNYGARNKKRIMDTMKFSIGTAVGLMLVGLVILQLFPSRLLAMFNASEEMFKIGVPALRTISLSFLFAGYCIIVGSVFQALGNGVYSLINSVVRQLLVLLPVAYVFAKLFGLSAVWFSFPIAELASVVLSSYYLKKMYDDVIKPLEQKDKNVEN